jgi:hypothetical protein
VDSPSSLYLAGESFIPTHNTSLLNALSGTDRAIVTPIPGTTRTPRGRRRHEQLLDATAELQRCAGSQFDPDVVSAFLRVLDERPYGYRAGQGDDFAIATQRADILSRLGRAGALQVAIETA